MKFAIPMLAGLLAFNTITDSPGAFAGPGVGGKVGVGVRIETHAKTKTKTKKRSMTGAAFTAEAKASPKELLHKLKTHGLKLTDVNKLGTDAVSGAAVVLAAAFGIAPDVEVIRLRLNRVARLRGSRTLVGAAVRSPSWVEVV